MSDYKHPYRDAEFILNELVGFDQLCADAGLEDINSELADVILTEAGKLGADVLAPLNYIGDTQGATLSPQGVVETPGFSAAYAQYVENGWPSLTAKEEFGGQNLPNVLGTAVNEIWHTANMSFALCPMLTQGAIESLVHHGSDALKQNYLPKLVSGEWTGTMNLTEPDAGSDLAAIKARATPEGDHYRITGQKIFITWGDHQMTENIVHLVLARLPDAPAGVKGISLFIVPKFLLDEQGNPAQLNDVSCVSLEHKLGIHGSPTCVMSFGDNGGAVGYIVGEPHQGLSYMFTMMNHARQSVGLQGVAISERSYQLAVQYAKDRLQGTRKDGSRFPIIEFPDVRRMLMQMKASIEAMRGLAYIAAAETDRVHSATDTSQAKHHQDRVDLLTPIVKGWITEVAQELTYLGVQVHGGMGFIEETGAAQHYRDARILTIYEGTTGIQALDLVGRKTLMNKGTVLSALLDEIAQVQQELAASSALQSEARALDTALTAAHEALQWLLDNAEKDASVAGSISVNFMMMMGYVCGGWVMGQSALKAQALLNAGQGDSAFLHSKLITSAFYCDHLLPRATGLLAVIKAGSQSVMSLPNDQF
ncbi:acyl-CoA dehydrogenase C-terminal domain-containing protein [Neptunomonas phycophila]|uniref:acyl-CoA dehydrogenase C-terminal domain-containing protein n=1 Tax=Neptunomonas TaxID=75687 RepID=UPI0015B7B276|nr:MULTISPECIES: acyl-CoA dehydrogenase C-terminal domain-containing protein [Neptunomonas]MDN2661308.1 acyl-CoA dehydrogenase C-terminal domain-containing protein [Neptunomonas sp. CHC150]MDO6783589.1 acyl-CoA dehydrogenase C-terminal domain-containing protein [Neptunomonas phycophila]QLE98393.1 acyl-CoA dehydrogenase [Neptunomonas phycophila]